MDYFKKLQKFRKNARAHFINHWLNRRQSGGQYSNFKASFPLWKSIRWASVCKRTDHSRKSHSLKLGCRISKNSNINGWWAVRKMGISASSFGRKMQIYGWNFERSSWNSLKYEEIFSIFGPKFKICYW